MFRWGVAYLGLVQNAIAVADGGAITDGSGVSFWHEGSHADRVWFDPIAGALTRQQPVGNQRRLCSRGNAGRRQLGEP